MEVLRSSIVTILIVRIFGAIAIYVDKLNFVYYDNSYHLYYGLIIVLVAMLTKRISKKIRYILLGIGLGLIIDDVSVITYIINGQAQNPVSDYWSPLFILPLLFGLLFISLFEEKLKKLIH